LSRLLRPVAAVLFLAAASVAALPCAAQEKDPALLVQQLADPTLRGGAREALLAMEPARAVSELDKALSSKKSSEQLRREILRVLPDFGARGTSVIVAALKDPLLEFEAARALSGSTGDRTVAESMFDLLAGSQNPKVRLLALEWLAENGDAKRVNGLLLGTLADSSDKVRTRAGELIVSRLGVPVLPELMEVLRQAEFSRSVSNRGLRLALIETLGLMGQKGPSEAARVVPTLLQALGEEDEAQVAVAALVRIGAPSVSSLLMILKAGDTRRAAAAMDALLSIGSKAAPEVVSLLQAKHPKMREMAQQFLSFYQDPAVFPLLVKLYAQANPEDKVTVLRILSLYGTRETVDFVVRATTDEDARVRAESVRILAATGDPAAVPVLLSRAEEDSDMDIRVAAIHGLYSMGELSAGPSFARMLEYEKWQVRLELLVALSYLGNPSSSIKAVADQLRHRKSEVATQAQRAVANITFMSGQRSPDEWMRDVRAIVDPPGGKDAVEALQKSVVAGDEEIPVLVFGKGKETILFLAPTVELNARLMGRYLGLLAEDRTVVVMPFPGCSQKRSDRPSLVECMNRVADRIELVRQELALQGVVVVSQGAASLAAIHYASRFRTAVRQVVVANPVFPRRLDMEKTLAATWELLPARWKKELEYLDLQGGKLSPRARNVYRSRVELAAEVRGEGRAMLVAPGYYGLAWLLDEVFLPYEDTSLVNSLAALEVPLLLIYGEADPTLNDSREAFRKIGRIRKNIVSTTLPGSIRQSPAEQSDLFQKAVLHFVESYRASTQPTGVGGAFATASVSAGEPVLTGVAGGAVAVGATAGDRTIAEGSKLAQFLTANEPDKVLTAEDRSSEAARKALEEAERAARAEDEARKKAEEEARQRAAEEERLRLEEEARLLALEEERSKAVEEGRLRAEEAEKARLAAEAQAQAEAVEKARSEQEAVRARNEEARRLAEEKARAEAELNARLAAEEEAARKAAGGAAEPAGQDKGAEGAAAVTSGAVTVVVAAGVGTEEARIAAEAAAKATADEEARIAAEEAAKATATEEARIAAEAAAKAKADEEARIAAEEAAKAKAEEEARIAAEAAAKAEAEGNAAAAELARAEAARAAESARVAAEAAAKARAEQEARIAAEAAAKAKADEEARVAAEEAAKAKADEEARVAAEEAEKARKADEESRRLAENAGGGNTSIGGGTGVTVGRESRVDKWTVLGWGLVGGGALLAGGGAAMHWKAFDAADAAGGLDPYLPDYRSRFDDTLGEARTWQGLSIAGYVLGAVSLLAGLDVLFDWPVPVRRLFGADSELAGWRVVPGLAPDGSAGLMFELPLP